MLINLNKRYLEYSALTKSVYSILLIIVIGISGWYIIPRLADKAYHGGFDQSKIDSIRNTINTGSTNKSQDELLLEVSSGNPGIDESAMYQNTIEVLESDKDSLSDTQKQTILNNLNKK